MFKCFVVINSDKNKYIRITSEKRLRPAIYCEDSLLNKQAHIILEISMNQEIRHNYNSVV